MNFLVDPPSSSADNQASSPDTFSQPQTSNKVGTGLQFFPNPILPVVFGFHVLNWYFVNWPPDNLSPTIPCLTTHPLWLHPTVGSGGLAP